jgi:hypothetical protein
MTCYLNRKHTQATAWVEDSLTTLQLSQPHQRRCPRWTHVRTRLLLRLLLLRLL